MRHESELDFAQNQCQKYMDKISDALNPVSSRDLPYIAFSLQAFTNGVIDNMDATQCAMMLVLKQCLDPKYQTIAVKAGTADTLKAFDEAQEGGGILNGI